MAHARGVRTVATKYGTESCEPRRDAALAALAARQYGVVSLAQLRELGWSDSAVRSRVARGRLHRVHRGVYAVGHRVLSWEAQVMAAVLACGNRAVASHRTAAGHLGLMPSGSRPIDVTVATGAGQSRPGIRAHRGRLL